MRSVSRRSAIRVALACATMPMLVAGCGDSGFHPLYATSPLVGGTNVAAKLASLEIAPIPSRVGQRVRNEMIYQSTGGGTEALNPVYRLEIVITESITPTLVQIDGNSSGGIYNLNAKFRLIRIADKTVRIANTGSRTAADQTMYPKKLGIFTPRSSAMTQTMRLGALPI